MPSILLLLLLQLLLFFNLSLVQLKCFIFITGAITNINTTITNDTVATIAAAPADPHSDHIHTTTNNTTTTTAQN